MLVKSASCDWPLTGGLPVPFSECQSNCESERCRLLAKALVHQYAQEHEYEHEWSNQLAHKASFSVSCFCRRTLRAARMASRQRVASTHVSVVRPCYRSETRSF